MAAYYNEHDPFAAAWLRNLMAAGLIAGGDVDERSIADVAADDLGGYRQHHFFAGIGGWAYALALAGWPADRPVWTGSCPCQPFSSAGRQGGALDERHLWPWWLRLIGECRPDAILGEQVEGAVGFGWVDRVFADLEAQGYACGAAVLGAHSVGAPHIRQRLFWVADRGMAHSGSLDLAASGLERGRALVAAEPGGTEHRGASGLADADIGGSGARRGDDGEERGLSEAQREPEHGAAVLGGNGAACGVADADEAGSDRQRHDADRCGEAGWVGNSDIARPQGRGIDAGEHAGQFAAGETGAGGGLADAQHAERGPLGGYRPDGRDGANSGWQEAHGEPGARSAVLGFWSDAVWLPCLDGKARRVEPQVQPLAHGIPNRVGLLRGSGNAITPQVAAEFVRAFMECLP